MGMGYPLGEPTSRVAPRQNMKARANNEQRHRSPAGGVALVLVWWGVLGGLWMLLVDTVSTAEVLCAVVVAAAGAFVTRLVIEGGAARMHHAENIVMALARQLARVPSDLWLLGLALWRALAGPPRPGRFHELALELPVDELGNGRRAEIELVGSLAPNTIVLGVDERRVVVHQLLARQGERESVVELGS
jgi:hypothetical protein